MQRKNGELQRQKESKENIGNEVRTAKIKKTRNCVDPVIQLSGNETQRKNVLQGESYINRKCVHVGSRQTRPNCHCKFKCFERVNEEKRIAVLSNVNEMREIQNTYIGGLITLSRVQRILAKTGEA